MIRPGSIVVYRGAGNDTENYIQNEGVFSSDQYVGLVRRRRSHNDTVWLVDWWRNGEKHGHPLTVNYATSLQEIAWVDLTTGQLSALL